MWTSVFMIMKVMVFEEMVEGVGLDCQDMVETVDGDVVCTDYEDAVLVLFATDDPKKNVSSPWRAHLKIGFASKLQSQHTKGLVG
ncbi:hypothetical protein Tco_0770753 [Tanacetum coccineum]|uniref:Uncharacterized protein n=1 Tax=Tanacetum coccineum TaxID=301880 RepID=A0ABQ4ZG03_9ASTR